MAAGGADPVRRVPSPRPLRSVGVLHACRRRSRRSPRRRLPHIARGRAAVRCRARPLPRRPSGTSSTDVEPFTVVDAGAGPGTLARTILAARPRCAAALRYIAVETSASQRALHPTEVESRPDVPDGPFDGVIVANELLDNLPFRLCVFDGGWREAYVAVAADGCVRRSADGAARPAARRTAGIAAARLARRAPRRRRRLGRRCPVTPSRAAASSLSTSPARRRPRWRCSRGVSGCGHIASTIAAATISPTPEIRTSRSRSPSTSSPSLSRSRAQAQFLRRWGIDELVAEGSARGRPALHAPDLPALAMRSRVVEAEALLDPAGLGAFLAVEWSGTFCAT